VAATGLRAPTDDDGLVDADIEISDGRIAAISPSEAFNPFIFQLPATKGRTPGVIRSSPRSSRPGDYHLGLGYAKRRRLAR